MKSIKELNQEVQHHRSKIKSLQKRINTRNSSSVKRLLTKEYKKLIGNQYFYLKGCLFHSTDFQLKNTSITFKIIEGYNAFTTWTKAINIYPIDLEYSDEYYYQPNLDQVITILSKEEYNNYKSKIERFIKEFRKIKLFKL